QAAGANDIYRALRQAAERGLTPTTRYLLIGNRQPNSANQQRYLRQHNISVNSLLNQAARYGHFDLALLLIELGANTWASSLREAAEGGHLDLATLMLEQLAAREQRYQNDPVWRRELLSYDLGAAAHGGHHSI